MIGIAVEVAHRQGINAFAARDVGDAAEKLISAIRPTDCVLVKASRSVGAERLVTRLIEHFGIRDMGAP